jgi:hypothetical protein
LAIVLGGVEPFFVFDYPAFHIFFGFSGVTHDFRVSLHVVGFQGLHPGLEGFTPGFVFALVTFESFHNMKNITQVGVSC